MTESGNALRGLQTGVSVCVHVFVCALPAGSSGLFVLLHISLHSLSLLTYLNLQKLVSIFDSSNLHNVMYNSSIRLQIKSSQVRSHLPHQPCVIIKPVLYGRKENACHISIQY